MRTIEIFTQNLQGFPQLEAMLEAACVACGLQIVLKTTLKQHSGSIHWHLKQGKAKGTLEVTLLPTAQRLWFSVHDNRAGDWIEPAMQALQKRLEEK